MATKEENQLKLTALREVVNNLIDITDEVKRLFDRLENFEWKGVKLKRDEALSLYQLRYRVQTERGRYNEGFEKLLKRLAATDNITHIVITLVNIDGNAFIVFSDDELKICLGIIYDDWYPREEL